MHNSRVSNFTVQLNELGRLGEGLRRPENVLGFRDGTVFASSNAGYISRIDPDGHQSEIGSAEGTAPTTMMLESEGSLIVNDTTDGKLHRLHLDGRYETVLEEIDGVPLGSANYVFRDRRDRIWIAVATRRLPPHKTVYVEPDGYIALLEDGVARIVADGLRWPNEVRLNGDETYAYVSETFGRRLIRLPLAPDGTLGEPEPIGPDPLGPDTVPDGIALDSAGNVWAAIISRNGLIVVEPDGNCHTVFEEPVPDSLAKLREGFDQGQIPFADIGACAGPELRLLTSVGFAGPDLRTMVMGSLAMDHLVRLEAPVSGLPLWHQAAAKAPPVQPPRADS